MKRKLNVIFLTMILIMSLLIVNVNAASFSTTLTPSATQVPAATEFTVTVSVSNLNVGDNGINEFSATLYYDTSVFETLTGSSVEGQNGWTSVYSTGTSTITVKKSSFVNKDEDIIQITLKTKSGIASGKTGSVSLSNISVSNSADKINGTDVSTTITVGSGSSVILGNNSNAGTISITGNKGNANAGNANGNVGAINPITPSNDPVENVKPTNNANDTDIPYTGSEGSAIIKIILGVVLVSLFMYIKFEKSNEVK